MISLVLTGLFMTPVVLLVAEVTQLEAIGSLGRAGGIMMMICGFISVSILVFVPIISLDLELLLKVILGLLFLVIGAPMLSPYVSIGLANEARNSTTNATLPH